MKILNILTQSHIQISNVQQRIEVKSFLTNIPNTDPLVIVLSNQNDHAEKLTLTLLHENNEVTIPFIRFINAFQVIKLIEEININNTFDIDSEMVKKVEELIIVGRNLLS